MGGSGETAEPLRSRRGSRGEDWQWPRHAGIHMGDRRRARRVLHGPGPGFLVRNGDRLPRSFQVLSLTALLDLCSYFKAIPNGWDFIFIVFFKKNYMYVGGVVYG